MAGWGAGERRAARRAAGRKTGTARSVLYLMRQRTLAAAAPASAGDGGRPTQRKQAPQRTRAARVCPHQRQRSRCKECGGASICQHQRRRSRCKECGGASICQHQRQRSTCKECGGTGAPASASTSAKGADARSAGFPGNFPGMAGHPVSHPTCDVPFPPRRSGDRVGIPKPRESGSVIGADRRRSGPSCVLPQDLPL